MSEQPEVETFVRKGADGTERIHRFAPWPTGDDGQPAMQVRMMVVEMPDGDGELRHLSYDDPPGMNMGVTPDQYRELLAGAVRYSDSEEEFTEMLVSTLVRDLVLAHGVHPAVAIPAVTDFARKVYAEFSA